MDSSGHNGLCEFTDCGKHMGYLTHYEPNCFSKTKTIYFDFLDMHKKLKSFFMEEGCLFNYIV